jgi:FtsP/CotA-like multicopper oxidase with cupredoxin domain
MNRRDFLKTTMAGVAGVATAPLFRMPVWAQAAPPASSAATILKAVTRSLDINGKAASVYGLVQGNGASGITMNANGVFDIELGNELPDPTLIHWHGLTPPWPMDGVPDTPALLLKSGETRRYAFPVRDAGTTQPSGPFAADGHI